MHQKTIEYETHLVSSPDMTWERMKNHERDIKKERGNIKWKENDVKKKRREKEYTN